jgi:hypothetical protein
MEPNPPLVWPTSESLPPWIGVETAETWFAATSALDDSGVTAIQEWLKSPGAKSAQLIVLVYAACATTKDVLSRLLWVAAGWEGKLECAVLSTGHYHTDANGTAVLLQRPGRRFPQLWTSNTSNFDLTVAPDGRLNVFIDAEATLVGRWTKWFAALWERSAPLTPLTADIPALVPARGTEEAARMWEAYQGMCAELGNPLQPETEEARAAAEKRIEEKAIRENRVYKFCKLRLSQISPRSMASRARARNQSIRAGWKNRNKVQRPSCTAVLVTICGL